MPEENKEIFVTETVLPPQEIYEEYLRNIFATHSLTNQGQYVQKLERELKNYLRVPFLELCGNGTLALQMGIRLLKFCGKKIITTPFTYVATASALIWENCQPVFIDIDPDTLCLDPDKVEKRLRQDCSIAGIIPVHVYGNACDVEAFDRISQQYAIPVFYDGAHAFGSVYQSRSLLYYGRASICSFHATKIFHTVEGGCLIAHSREMDREARLMRAFGHIGDKHYSPGINAKLSELHAVMGLSLLPEMTGILAKRAAKSALYDELLNIRENPSLRTISLAKGLEWNHAYYPVIFKTANLCDDVIAALEKQRIHPRRYFYPALSELPYIQNQSCPVAEDISRRVICIPFWPDMEDSLIKRIARIIMETVDQ